MREEISDMIPTEFWASPDFKKGFVLRFDEATLKVTKINRKAKRAWAEHVELVEQIVAVGHSDHLLDSTPEVIEEYGVPFCQDCQEPISTPATVGGKLRAKDRDENELSDGTRID